MREHTNKHTYEHSQTPLCNTNKDVANSSMTVGLTASQCLNYALSIVKRWVSKLGYYTLSENILICAREICNLENPPTKYSTLKIVGREDANFI